MKYIFDNDMKIHEKIRNIRIAKGYTQEYVATKLNIDPANYGRIERGKTALTVERLEQLSKILDFDIASLFNDNQNINYSAEIINYLKKISQLQKELTEIAREINKKLK